MSIYLCIFYTGSVWNVIETKYLLKNRFFKCGSFSDGSDRKESAHNAGDLGSIPGLGRSAGEGNSYPLQYSGLKILFFKMKLKKIKEKNVRACIYECGCIDGQTPNRAPLMMHNLYCQDQGCWNSVCLQPYYRVSVKFQGMYSPWGHKKSDTTEQLSLSLQGFIIKHTIYVVVRNSHEKIFLSFSSIFIMKI